MEYQRLTMNLGGKDIRHEVLNGNPHLVVPAVILAEDVLDGSGGPVFYPDDENEKSTISWNMKPIVVYHPEKDGKFISAADPVVLDTCGIGVLMRTNNKNKKLGAEVWLDVEKTKSVDSRILTALNKGEKVEVSTGLAFDLDKSPGEFNSKKYMGIARNYRPDHLAVLPDKIGALSVKDGGGLLQLNEARRPERTQLSLRKSLESALASVKMEITGNEMSFSDITCQLSDLLSAKFGKPGKYWSGWVRDVYPDHVIFGMEDKDYMIGYSKSENSVSLVGDETEVERIIEYRTVGGESYSSNSNGSLQLMKKGTEMAETKFDKKAHVKSLIGNGFEEADQGWLEKLEDSNLQKIQPKIKEVKKEVEVKNEKKETKEIVANNETVKVETPKTPTFEELLKAADPVTRNHFEKIKRDAAAEKDRLVKTLTANESCPFSEEYLNGLELDMLRGMSAMAARNSEPEQADASHPMFKPNFMGNAGGVSSQIYDNARPSQTYAPAVPDLAFQPVIK